MEGELKTFACSLKCNELAYFFKAAGLAYAMDTGGGVGSQNVLPFKTGLQHSMFSFEGCHPEHIPFPSLLILQINVCSAEGTVSFKVKGLFSLAVQRTAATY